MLDCDVDWVSIECQSGVNQRVNWVSIECWSNVSIKGIDWELSVEATSTHDQEETDFRNTNPLRTPRTKLSIKNDPITTSE